MSPLALIAAAAAAVVLASSKKSNAASMPDSVMERIQAALASGNASTMRAAAAQLRAEGWTQQAKDLERAAMELEQSPPAPSSSGVLKRGSTGDAVRSWQTFLRGQGYPVEADGVFGVGTEDATKAFQRAHKLTADGIVGPDTLKASQTLPPAVAVKTPAPAAAPPPSLAPVAAPSKYLQRGSSGSAVAAWQTFLRGQGYAVEVDSEFGVQTHDATKAFQRSKSLTADGIVGPDTQAAAAKAGANVPAPAAPAPAAAPAVKPPVAAPAAPLPAVPATARLLSKGANGTDVAQWQTYLVSQGYTSVAVDGVFGIQTDDATRAFQRSRGLPVDGVVGPTTLKAAQTAAPAAAVQASAAPVVAAAAAVVSGLAAAITRTLSRNMQGNDVAVWQTFLRGQGYSGVSVDGLFGVQTEDGTKAFQRSKTLTGDGIVGPATLKAAASSTATAAVAAVAPVVAAVTAAAPTAAAVAAALGSITRTLQLGTSGADVKAWQLYLQSQMPFGTYTNAAKLAADGAFGTGTADATKAWQKARKLTADGIVGAASLSLARGVPVAVATPAPAPVTAAALAAVKPTVKPSSWRVLKRGASGNDVREWQTVLVVGSGYKLTIDGVFGADTEKLTKEWQGARKLVADGIVGAGTVAYLKSKPPQLVTVAGDLGFATASPLPGVIPHAAPPEVDIPFDASLAARLTLNLSTSAPGQEDRAMVEDFQRLQGLKPTGAYGPGTAAALITRYGLRPPNPFYWPSEHSRIARRNYRELLLAQARKDPARAREWQAAASRL